MSNEKQREPLGTCRGNFGLDGHHRHEPHEFHKGCWDWKPIAESAAPAHPVPPDPEMLGTCDALTGDKLHSPEPGCINYKPYKAPVLTQPSADDWRLDFLAALELVHAHLMDLSPSESKTADLLMQKHLKVLRVDAERPILPVPPPNIIDIVEQYVLRGELEGLRGWIRAQRELAPERSSSPAVAPTKYKDVCDMLRDMATEKPDMRLDVAASVLLGALIPVTQEDIKRGQEIAKELGLASPAVAGRTQGDVSALQVIEALERGGGLTADQEKLIEKFRRQIAGAALRESARKAPSDITSKLRKLEPITACPKCEAETENEAMTECCGNDDCPMDGKWNEALASLNREQIFVEIELREEFPEAPAAPAVSLLSNGYPLNKLADEIENTVFFREIDVVETGAFSLQKQIANFVRSKVFSGAPAAPKEK